MDAQTTIEIIVIALLLISGYIFLLQTVLRKNTNRGASLVIAVVLLVLYGSIAGVLLMVLNSFGSMDMTMQVHAQGFDMSSVGVLGAMVGVGYALIMACLVVLTALNGLIRNFSELRKGYLALFLVYLLGLVYITIINRIGTVQNTVFLSPFSSLADIRKESGSTDYVNHMLMNVAMFVPMGMLLPAIYPEKLNKGLYAFAIGLMATTIIETAQYMLRLGQYDIDDMIANTAGALAGFAFYRIYDHFFGERYEEEEDEEEEDEEEE